MKREALLKALQSVPGIEAEPAEDRGLLVVRVGNSVPTLELDPKRVLRTAATTGPADGLALKLDLVNGGAAGLMFVTEGDVAFNPDTSVLTRPSGMSVTIRDLPPVTGWSDMARMFDAAEAADLGSIDVLDAQVMSCQAMLAGAEAAGLRVDQSEFPARLSALLENLTRA